MTLYYGARLEGIKGKTTSTSQNLVSANPPQSSSSHTDGYSIVPGIGFQYQLIERLSIGAEVGWDHARLDQVTSSPQSSSTASESEITTDDTRADIVVRFFF